MEGVNFPDGLREETVALVDLALILGSLLPEGRSTERWWDG